MANMEDLLDLYAEPYDPRRPVVCFDETSTQLLAETRPSLPPRPGIPLRQDYEYRREGVRNLFLACEPLAGWRHVAVTQRRTMEDFAHQMRWLVDEAYPETPVVRVVMDNLNTHRPASLYETFPAPEARRIAKRLEFHYTPKHGSWLNMAEIEFSVLSRSCLKQRLPDEEALHREVQALVKERNAAQATIQWRFNTQDARTKLHRPYPFDSKVAWVLDYRGTVDRVPWAFELTQLREDPKKGYHRKIGHPKERKTLDKQLRAFAEVPMPKVPRGPEVLQRNLNQAFEHGRKENKTRTLSGAKYCLVIHNQQFTNPEDWEKITRPDLGEIDAVILLHAQLVPPGQVWQVIPPDAFGRTVQSSTVEDLERIAFADYRSGVDPAPDILDIDLGFFFDP